MLTFQNEDAYGVVEKNLGADAVQELKSSKLDFLPFPKLEAAVEDDVKYLKGTKLVPDGVTISGWVYEVETGKTKQVV
jgi:carbonic anhydrase